MVMMDVGNKMVWRALKPYLPSGTRLVSVYRSRQDQLNIIVGKARKHGFRFPKPPLVHDESSWKDALAFIRGKGYKVAAPGKSVHQSGMAYDLAGASLKLIAAGVRKAVADGRIVLARRTGTPLRIEPPPQNCVHVEIEKAVMDHEPFETA